MSPGDRPEAPLHPQARDPLSRPGMNQPPARRDAQAALEGIRGVGVSQGPGLQPSPPAWRPREQGQTWGTLPQHQAAPRADLRPGP